MLSHIAPPGYGFRRSSETGLINVTYRGERIGSAQSEAAARLVRRNHARRHLVDGYLVRRVTSGSHGPACQVHRTVASTVSDVVDVNGLLKMVNTTAAWYGQQDQVKPTEVGGVAYRWSWEWFTPDGHRITEMIVATPIR